MACNGDVVVLDDDDIRGRCVTLRLLVLMLNGLVGLEKTASSVSQTSAAG